MQNWIFKFCVVCLWWLDFNKDESITSDKERFRDFDLQTICRETRFINLIGQNSENKNCQNCAASKTTVQDFSRQEIPFLETKTNGTNL